MQGTYDVTLTPVAEKSYSKICHDAEACIEAGDEANRKVSILTSIDKALEEVIPVNPFDPRLALAGLLSFVYVLKIGTLSVSYVPDANTSTVWVYRIGKLKPPTELSVLRDIIQNGQLEEMLKSLGIDATDILSEQISSPFLN